MRGRRPLHAHVSLRIVAVATLSVVALASFLSWRQLRDTQRELAERRGVRAAIIARALDGFLTSHEHAVEAIAELSPADGSGLQASIDTLRRTHPDILTALAADARGTIVAASPRPAAEAPSVIGQGIADREYFRESMSRNVPYVSGAFLGRGFGSDPIVAIAAPLRGADGAPRGIIEGSINLRRLEAFTSLVRGLEGARLAIADPAGMVVFSSIPDLSTLTDTATRRDLLEAAERPGVAVFSGSDGTEWSIASARSDRGWRVFVLQDMAVTHRRIAGQFGITALFVAIVAVVSLAVAGTLAQRVTKSLEQLAAAVRSLRGGEAPAKIPIPHPKAPVEVAELFDDVRAMAVRVHESRKDLEQTNLQLAETLDLARAGSRTKTAFLAKMSHELRTPLNAVIGFTGILEKRLAEDEKGRELARRAQSAGQGMLHMIDELLEIARVESGQAELNPVDAHLAAIMLEGVRAADAAHPGAVDRIALVAADDRIVRVDRDHFAKAVSNVAAAAIELTAATVRVQAQVVQGDKGASIIAQWTIREVVDRDTLGSLLDPFWQGEPGSGTAKFGATRLGLALAHRYAEIMGGNLGVRTADGETIFTLSVPNGIDAGTHQPS